MPLRPGESLMTYPDMRSLAAGVAEALDDLPLLNRLQDGAFAACAGSFDWATRGRRLLAGIEDAAGRLAAKG